MPSSPEEQESKPAVNAPQVRSRITVVCAECKRLKLKCDRDVPACSSCKKRGTVARCVYSPKAFEKLDLHSLHNRLARVEASLAQLTAVPATPPVHHRHGSALTLTFAELSQVWLDTNDIAFIGGAGSNNNQSPAFAQPTLFLPPVSVYFDQQHSTEPSAVSNPQVTPELVKAFPNSRDMCLNFLDNAEKTLRIRPSFGWTRFKACAELLISSTDTSRRRLATVNGTEDTITQRGITSSVTFFAATCSALAIGALSHESTNSEQPDEFLCSANFLHGLSQQALSVVEMHQNEQAPNADLDLIVASILQLTYALRSGLIHSSRINGARKSMGLIGKMVNIARQISLNIDPQELGQSLDDSESENRRRLWWQIVWYDTYISDIMGHPPLIAENSFTTKIPHDGRGYLGLSCRLTHLVRKMMTLTGAVKSNAPSGRMHTLEEAVRFETEVGQLIRDLPLALDTNTMSAGPNGFGDLDQSALMAQQYEITIMAQKLLIRVYLSFLRPPYSAAVDMHDGNNGHVPNWAPPHQATHAIVNAAHTTIETCAKMYAIWQDTAAAQPSGKPSGSHIPALFDLYALGRSLFDAGVICAHVAIHQPNTVWSKVALEDVHIALQYLKGDSSLAERMQDLSYTDAVQLLEMLKDKAEIVASGGSPNGLKRKSSVVDEPGASGSAIGPRKSPSTERSNAGTEDAQKGRRHPSEYPSVGIRVRPNSKLPSPGSLSPKLGSSRRRVPAPAADVIRGQSRTQIPPLRTSLTPSGPLTAPSTNAGINSRSGLRSNAPSNQASPVIHPLRSFQQSPLAIHPSDVITNLSFSDGVTVDPSAPIRGKGYQLWLNACWDAYRQGGAQPEYAGSQYEEPAIYGDDRSPNTQYSTIPLGTFPYPRPSVSPIPAGEGGSYSFSSPKDTITSIPRAEPSVPQHNTFSEPQNYYHHYSTQPSFEGLSSPGQQQQIHSNLPRSLLGLGMQGLGSSSTMEMPSSTSATPGLYDEDLRPSTADAVAINNQPAMMQNGSTHLPSQGWGAEEYTESQAQPVLSVHYWQPQHSQDYQYFQR